VNAGGPTASTNVVDAVSEPDVPVTVTSVLPLVAVLAAVRVKTDGLLGNGIGLGDHDAVTPAGRPLTESETAPANPP
jgi:hypothetical protein